MKKLILIVLLLYCSSYSFAQQKHKNGSQTKYVFFEFLLDEPELHNDPPEIAASHQLNHEPTHRYVSNQHKYASTVTKIDHYTEDKEYELRDKTMRDIEQHLGQENSTKTVYNEYDKIEYKSVLIYIKAKKYSTYKDASIAREGY